MQIWVTEIGEPLPLEGDVRLYRYGMLTREWSAAGHEVVWWTSSFSHSRKVFVRDRDCEESTGGVTLRVVHGPGYDRNISLRRLRHHRHFARRFHELAREEEAPDIIVSTVPTLEAAEAAVRLGIEISIPVVADIRDEWPEVLVDLAPGPLHPLARLALLRSFKRMSYICRNAPGLIAVSRKYLDYALGYAGREQGPGDAVFPMGYGLDTYDPAKVAAAGKWWREQGVREEAFVCCFFGTIGKYFNLESVIEAARELERESAIQFVMCGEGSSLKRYRRLASGVPSVIFPGWVDGPAIQALMGLADAGLAPYITGARMSLPNKPFEYWAGGLPVISSLRGELESILEENRCGFTYNAESAGELISIIRRLRERPELVEEAGRNARDLLESEYLISDIAGRMIDYFEGIIDR